MTEETYRPSETQCPVCYETFFQARREQGGGVRQIYCSSRCRAKDWARGNGAKRKATILKYEAVPVNKQKKRERTRAATLKKYGWTEARFQLQLKRQGNACAGCLAAIDRVTARIDHSHTTGEARGLLCDHCNWLLGNAKDDRQTLRRLAAYLERTPDQPLVYVIGALKNQRIPVIGNLLRAHDFDAMDEWCTPGEHADLCWQQYEKVRGRTYQQALAGRAATNIFMFDRAYIDLADAAVLVMPAGKSAMLELGYLVGRGKFACIFLDGEEPDRYDVMPNFASAVYKDEMQLIQALYRWRHEVWSMKEVNE